MTPEETSIIAARRFGFGRSGTADEPPVTRESVLAQLKPEAALLSGPDLPSYADVLRAVAVYRQELKAARAAQPKPAAMDKNMMADGTKPMHARKGNKPAGFDEKNPAQVQYRKEASARLDRQISTQTPVVEQLVNFWSNHFCISAKKNQSVRAGAGAYEREAIRPFVLGRFRDMLTAVAHHPAMLDYLDNSKSVGPMSKVGQNQKKGLNENLAREIMELHTLGVDGGYTQADVTAFARALTGWTKVRRPDEEDGAFEFTPQRHEPGSVTVMGRGYGQAGEAQGQAILDMLAEHPATARHVTHKLAQWFVGENPPKALTDRMAETFRKTGGDLMAVTRGLIGADEAWAAPAAKVMSPWDMLVHISRTLGAEMPFQDTRRMLTLFGQPLWEPPFPTGWPDGNDTWAAPDSLLELLDAVNIIARRYGRAFDIPQLAHKVLGPLLTEPTLTAIRRAETKEQALALLVMSPEFLRR